MTRAGLDPSLRANVFARTMLFQACWSFEGMQNLGLLFSLDPWLRRAYEKDRDYRDAARRHLEYFNTHPYMAGFVAGVMGGMEERLARAPEEDKAVLRDRLAQLKKALGSGLAAVGDALFWGSIRPALAAWTLLSWIALRRIGAPHPVLLGALFFFCAYNASSLLIRWRGIALGYRFGEDLPLRLKDYRWQEKARWIRRFGLAAALLVCAAEVVAASARGARGAVDGLLLLAGSVILRNLGFSALRIYAAAAMVGGLIALARWL